MKTKDSSHAAPLLTVGYLVCTLPNGKKRIVLGRKASTKKSRELGIANKLIGYGGFADKSKGDVDEKGNIDSRKCFIREFAEETSGFPIDSANIKRMARCVVRNERFGSTFVLHYFLVAVDKCDETPPSGEEILDPTWHDVEKLPDNMLGSDFVILPRILSGEEIKNAFLRYDENMNLVETNFPQDTD